MSEQISGEGTVRKKKRNERETPNSARENGVEWPWESLCLPWLV